MNTYEISFRIRANSPQEACDSLIEIFEESISTKASIMERNEFPIPGRLYHGYPEEYIFFEDLTKEERERK